MEYVYAALLLHKLGKEINEENLKNTIAATGIEIGSDDEAKVKSLVASLKGVDIEKELESASSLQVSGTPTSSGEAQKEEKKEAPKEKKKEAAAEGLSALFG